MTNLLDFALEAHGGFDNWKGVTGVDLRLTLGYAIETDQLRETPNSPRRACTK
jgi:hypothetical protein